MSHRTEDLPPLKGLAHTLRELRYHEASRQVLAVVLIVVYAATAKPVPALAAIGLTLAALGALVRMYASGFIVKNEQLATDGPYRFVRHPLYTGNILLVIGFALAGSRWWGLPLAALLFWFYYPPAIEYEDRKLRRLFGARWEEWASRTPALMPRFGGQAPGDGSAGRWSFATSTKRNGEIALVAISVLCMAWIVWRL